MIDFLHKATNPPALPKPPIKIETNCALSGKRIKKGYSITDIIRSTSSEVSDTFRYRSRYVSIEAAELYRAQRLLRGNLLFFEDRLLRPLVSKATAIEQNRPCWRDLINEIELGTRCVAIFSNETKKRLWYQAQLSTFGTQWRPFFNGNVVKSGKTFQSPEIKRLLTINIKTLQLYLQKIERLLDFGFSKQGIYNSLLSETKILTQVIEKIGIKAAINLEKELLNYRSTDEFLLGLFIAQRLKKES